MNIKLNLDPVYALPSYLGRNGIYDGGDTCANTFTVLYCAKHMEMQDYLAIHKLLDSRRSVELLTSADGWPRRSPDDAKWYGRPGRCSRDQLTPYLAFVAVSKWSTVWKPLLLAIAKHCFIFANNSRRNFVYDSPEEHAAKSTPDVPYRPEPKTPDFIGPDVWQIVVRGVALRSPECLRPLFYLPLALLDLHGLGAALLTKFKPRKLPSDERNQGIKTHFAATYLPTIVSILSYKIYSSTEPNTAFKSFWTQAGEPEIYKVMTALYKE